MMNNINSLISCQILMYFVRVSPLKRGQMFNKLFNTVVSLIFMGINFRGQRKNHSFKDM